jgi:hypothetical protein
LFFLPSQRSLVNIDGLERDIRKEMSEPIVQRISEASAEGRVLAIGTTNLDLGIQRVWDLGSECQSAPESQSADRLVEILLASSAIPGAFPPIEIDDYLYADGAISANILYDDSTTDDRDLTRVWAAEYPNVPMPLTRYWVIINGQLEAPPQITQPTWVSVTASALAIAVRSSTTTAMHNLAGQLKLINIIGMGRKEMHYVCIPGDWRAPIEGRFQEQTMQSLADLGHRMAADPKSWTTLVVEPALPAKR